ncbi:DUF5658 family protein [Planctomicrobium sp. SH527]|uniref:DUF5658 family protein n=1 Tax=Planctomicrobium sp. SH527 TaxID=3448123 RepID=UPI003F5B451B
MRDAKHPPETGKQTAKVQTSWFHHIARRQLPLETETTIFILVSILDFFVTYWLLMSGGFRESNPLANWFLEGWGVTKGMLLYKLALVTIVCLISQIVYPYRPRTARLLLIGGTVAAGYVVIHGLRLYLAHGPAPATNPLDLF